MNTSYQRIVRKYGIQVSRNRLVCAALKNTSATYNIVRRMKIIAKYGIDTLLDIGANTGQYALDMRHIGYVNKIISFEPLKSAFQELEKVSSGDDNWYVKNYALGNEDRNGTINVSDNSVSSSILDILPLHLKIEPKSKIIAKEEIVIKKLDSVFHSLCDKNDKIMIKSDTQGYEKSVIEGASDSLHKIKIIQIEMSLVPLYDHEPNFLEMIKLLDNKGFQLFMLEQGHCDPYTHQLLQVDGIFVQKNATW